MIRAKGYEPGTEFISFDEKPSTSLDATTLNLPETTGCLSAVRIRSMIVT